MDNKDIIKNLNSSNTDTVLKTLKFISQQGNKDVLINVIELLNTSSDDLIKNEIIKILENLKEQECVEIIVDSINNKRLKNILSDLISSSWKNGLSYEEYVESFVDVFINSDFQLAFDAFTVIDHFENIDPAKADICVVKLNNTVENSKKDKRPLYHELINVIIDLKENPAK